MSYTVTITYAKPAIAAEPLVAPICRIFYPTAAYIDSVAYKEGLKTAGNVVKYGKSVYATNVEGWGETPAVEPYATTSFPFPVPMAQFKLAMVGEEGTATFTVADYKEAFYYMQVGEALKEQGFTVTVAEDEG